MTTLSTTSPRSSILSTRLHPLYALFFFSGFPALIYQLTWQRSLFRIFGVNTESVTIVVTAFMLGLGLGSLAGGWITRSRNVDALLLLGVIELLTAAFGVVSLPLFEQVGRLALNWSLLAVTAINLALVLVPTLLMGATLPILVSHLVRISGQIGTVVGTLYYVNTLGAGVACLLCAAVIFPFLGMHAAVWIAAGINVIVGGGAILLAALIGSGTKRKRFAARRTRSNNRFSDCRLLQRWPRWAALFRCPTRYSCSEPYPSRQDPVPSRSRSLFAAFSLELRAVPSKQGRPAKAFCLSTLCARLSPA